ncbi:MAG: hypothetical protein LLG05_16545 [Porphyromonadaceae bacterium]|nr:hypothetical protein [Porphyromonadaceae bacterium]
MFTYRKSGKSSLKFSNTPMDTIPKEFWTEIHSTDKKGWPAIVRNYKLSPVQLEAAAGRIKREEESRKLQESWNASVSAYYSKTYPIKV